MSSSYLDRMIRAARLDVTLYQEVKGEKRAFAQAMGLVVLASVAAAVGSSGQTKAGIGFIVFSSLISLISWFVWAFLIYTIGTRVLPEPGTQGDYGQLLRTIGFSSAPGILNILGVIPQATLPVLFVVSVWTLVAMVLAVRVALNFSNNLRAAAVCALGWILQLLVFILLGSLFGKLPSGPA